MTKHTMRQSPGVRGHVVVCSGGRLVGLYDIVKHTLENHPKYEAAPRPRNKCLEAAEACSGLP